MSGCSPPRSLRNSCMVCTTRNYRVLVTDRVPQLRSMWVEWRQSTCGGNNGSSCSSFCMRLPRWVLGVKVTPSWEVGPLKAKPHACESNSRSRTSSGVHSATGFRTIGYRWDDNTPQVILVSNRAGFPVDREFGCRAISVYVYYIESNEIHQT